MANTWNQATPLQPGVKMLGDNKLTLLLHLTGLSATTTVGSLTELIEVKPGWGTLNWGENGWGSVESATETLTGLSATTSVGSFTIPDQTNGSYRSFSYIYCWYTYCKI